MKVTLQESIDAGKSLGKKALYFGCWNGVGHYLHDARGHKIYDRHEEIPDFPWSPSLTDGGLLKNGKHPDVYDGKVFWTCGGTSFWYAFFWWDNSVDRRGASNSGLFARGFGWPEAEVAFAYACAEFPAIIARQKHLLVLQDSLKGNREIVS